MGYVIKLTDPQYSGYAFCIKDCIPAFGNIEFFSEDAVFGTEQEAEEHIQTMLKSGWYRPDITADNFEIVEVRKYPELGGLFYYTNKGYEKFKEMK